MYHESKKFIAKIENKKDFAIKIEKIMPNLFYVIKNYEVCTNLLEYIKNFNIPEILDSSDKYFYQSTKIDEENVENIIITCGIWNMVPKKICVF
jgi:hypothetical protein